MPENTNQIANEDYMELELAHSGQNVDSFAEEQFSENAKLKPLIKTIYSAKVNKNAAMLFLGSVGLDLERRNPVGIKELFTVWLELGNKYWLNPMDRSNGIGFLDEILFKYRGDAQVLRPFIALLTQLARLGISPRSFAEYVILPRMRQDYNWRKWQENHLEPLRIIAQLLTAAKNHPPFNQEHLGSGRTKLARDIVLVRYIGRPLAQYQTVQLRDEERLKSYREAWQKISLKQPLSLYFMRNNALHFIYIMSGKIDLIQLIAIVEQLPEIERSITSAFPDSNISLKNIKSINLYDYDIEYAIQARKNRGFHSLDFAIEIKAYFDIVKTLLGKATGVYLCAYYATLLKRYKDPIIAETINNLVRLVDDRGGMHIYKWHTEKLLGKTKIAMQPYLSLIEANNGCDPTYPRVYLLFRDEDTAREATDILNFANNLGLDSSHFENKDSISYKDLLGAYIREYPDTEELIENYRDSLLMGKDRQWTMEYTQRLDQLRRNNHTLYGPLLRSVIRGVGLYWSVQKSSSFAPLFEHYGTVHSSTLINARTQFKMPIMQIGQTDAEHDKYARTQINIGLIEKVWAPLCANEQKNAHNTIAFINDWIMELHAPLENAFEKKVFLEKGLQEIDDAQEKEILKKDIAKQDKTISTLQEKKAQYTKVIEHFDSLNDLQKFVVTLVLAGAVGKQATASRQAKTNEDTEKESRQVEDFPGFTTALLLQRYKQLESITSRLDFLIDDVSVDVLNYQQLTYLLNLLETLFFTLREDPEIASLLEEDTILQEILEYYIITKKKQITVDALDAAAKKITGFASLQAERAKWQGILVSMKDEDGKFFHNMEIYTSKTFMDSHYGDMGGICLSTQPDQILRPGFFVQRLADLTDRQIIGMSILYLSTGGFSSDKVSAGSYWHAFGFNPLFSVLKHCTTDQALFLYLQFRLNIEKVAWKTKLPVVLSGIETPGGLISNSGHFGNLILAYEAEKSTAKRVHNAKGFSVYYSQEQFARALVIIDPRGFDDTTDLSQIPTFYAHRELGGETQ